MPDPECESDPHLVIAKVNFRYRQDDAYEEY